MSQIEQANAAQLVHVPFHGDVLEAIHSGGKSLTSLLRICENLGVEYRRQLKKLRGSRWAKVSLCTTHDKS